MKGLIKDDSKRVIIKRHLFYRQPITCYWWSSLSFPFSVLIWTSKSTSAFTLLLTLTGLSRLYLFIFVCYCESLYIWILKLLSFYGTFLYVNSMNLFIFLSQHHLVYKLTDYVCFLHRLFFGKFSVYSKRNMCWTVKVSVYTYFRSMVQLISIHLFIHLFNSTSYLNFFQAYERPFSHWILYYLWDSYSSDWILIGVYRCTKPLYMGKKSNLILRDFYFWIFWLNSKVNH